MSDKVSPASGSSVAGAAGRGSEAGASADGPGAGEPAGEAAAGRGGSLAAMLETLRAAASAHDTRAEPPPLPDTGPLPGEGDSRP
ncbi:MAG TPA: hypothetical protein VGG35_13560 [Streptosporangiaceae bacterium]